MIDQSFLKETIENHKKFWEAIADFITQEEFATYELENFSIRKLKETVFLNIFPDCTFPFSYCFLCEFASGFCDNIYDKCKFCPLQDPDNESRCLNGLYAELIFKSHTNDFLSMSSIARKIANLPIINPLYLDEIKEEKDGTLF